MNNKDLIAQYVDTGLQIPEYQMKRLPKNILDTYLRKRILAAKHNFNIDKYEFDRMDDSQKQEIIPMVEEKFKGSNRMEQWELDLLPNGQEYIHSRISNGSYISQSVFENLPDSIKRYYLENVITKGFSRRLAKYEWNYLSDELKKAYVTRYVNETLRGYGRISSTNRLEPHELQYLMGDVKDRYFNKLIDNPINMLDYELPYLSKEEMHNLIENAIEDGFLTKKLFSYASDEQKYRYIVDRMKDDDYINQHEKEFYNTYREQNQL